MCEHWGRLGGDGHHYFSAYRAQNPAFGCQPLPRRGFDFSHHPQIHKETKKAPVSQNRGSEKNVYEEPLDAPILSQGTNQARRGSRKRPDPPRGQPPAGQDLPRRNGL